MDTVREGDTVLVYIDEKRKFVIRAERGKILGTDRGYITHDEIIGRKYGELVKTSMNQEAYILKPLLQDYIAESKRVTQIIYPKDAGLITHLSSIGPGSKVGEAGVGTGALTITLATIIGDNGVVYGFDILDKAIECTRQNLEKTGLIHRVILMKKDIREDIDIEPLDAFFLDIPDPWNALRSVYNVLKPSRPILIFTPTVNQVEKTIIALLGMPFIDIHVYETILREYMINPGAIRPRTRMIGHTGYIVFARKVIKN
ncbi:MAG: tRNA (adenine-N1)-methyltransferase [Desulfurococcaceae archaeon]